MMTSTDRKPHSTAWAIGGLDPSGGAGILADIQAFSAFSGLGVHGMAVVTTLTSQSIDRCTGFDPVPATTLAAQLRTLLDQHAPGAIKIGLLGDAETARVIAAFLRDQNTVLRVVDPVMVSSTGRTFFGNDVFTILRDEILPQTDVLTPNLAEAEAILGRPIEGSDEAAMLAAARDIRAMGPRLVVLKGGHAVGTQGPRVARDLVVDALGAFFLDSPRFPGDPRGTGCTFAAALAGAFATGLSERDACVCAKAYVTRGIRRSHFVATSPDAQSTRRALFHAAWPVAAEDFPRLVPADESSAPGSSFPDCGDKQLGFYPIVDRAAWVERLLPLGVTTVQIRVKDLQGEALRSELRAAIACGKRFGARVFVNDHWQDALACGAYGVHLGQEDLDALTTDDWEKLLASGVRLGVSTHSHEELARALAVGPSYIALGPIFPTTLKEMRFGPQGLGRLAEWRALTSLPLVAIGGIKREDATALLNAGADAIAVVSDITMNKDPEGRTRDWLAAFATTFASP